MYKIYVNGRLLILLSETELKTIAPTPDKTTLVSAFVGKKKIFRQHVDLLNKSPEMKQVYIWSSDLTHMWQEFTEAFQLIVAAGGLVTNEAGEILVFLRHGVWDLPKGKIDPGEVPTEAALREVEEECGITDLILGQFICHSYHTYQGPKKMVLKKTWWYHMQSKQSDLVPQAEEGIELVIWEPKGSVQGRIDDFYPNLHVVFAEGL
jgi:8-oxo-dGTP pyrophosphatase MutT (NUDIX family)